LKEIGPETDHNGAEVVDSPANSFVLDALETVRTLADAFPGDAGILTALLLNRVTLARGEALYLPAGNIHAYLSGLGIELMTASDNVLRGGLTPKHIDVDELLAVLDAERGLHLSAPEASP
jgi:mannose-6-phosphate isomerase class I